VSWEKDEDPLEGRHVAWGHVARDGSGTHLHDRPKFNGAMFKL